MKINEAVCEKKLQKTENFIRQIVGQLISFEFGNSVLHLILINIIKVVRLYNKR